jgi:hypothetical protein
VDKNKAKQTKTKINCCGTIWSTCKTKTKNKQTKQIKKNHESMLLQIICSLL